MGNSLHESIWHISMTHISPYNNSLQVENMSYTERQDFFLVSKLQRTIIDY